MPQHKDIKFKFCQISLWRKNKQVFCHSGWNLLNVVRGRVWISDRWLFLHIQEKLWLLQVSVRNNASGVRNGSDAFRETLGSGSAKWKSLSERQVWNGRTSLFPAVRSSTRWKVSGVKVGQARTSCRAQVKRFHSDTFIGLCRSGR